MPLPRLSHRLLVVLLPLLAPALTACGDVQPGDRFDSPAHSATAFSEHFLERHAPELCTFTGTVAGRQVTAYHQGADGWEDCLEMWARSFDLYEPDEEPRIGPGVGALAGSDRFAAAHWPGFRIDLARSGQKWLVTGIQPEPGTALD